MTDKNEAAQVADVQRRHGKQVPVRFPVFHGGKSPHSPREIPEPPPSPEAIAAVEKSLASAAGVIDFPDQYLAHLLTITLNKLDQLPPVRKRKDSKVIRAERKSRKTLQREVDQLKYAVAAFKQAYSAAREAMRRAEQAEQTGAVFPKADIASNYNRAIIVYGFACNLIQSTIRRFDDQELFRGRCAIADNVKAGKTTASTHRNDNADKKASVIEDVQKMLKDTPPNKTYVDVGNRYGLSKRTVMRWWKSRR